MRKILILAMFFTAAPNLPKLSAQILEPSNLGAPAKEFISVFFPETGVMSVALADSGYRVILDDFTSLDFDYDFSVIFVDCRESTIYTFVPDNILNPDVLRYVGEKYPRRMVVALKMKGQIREAVLDDGTRVKFVKNRIVN